MGRYFAGETAPFRTAADRKALVGKYIRYVRHCDIDKSGRGYIFPRMDTVVESVGINLFFDSGSSVARGDLVEVQVIESGEVSDG